MALGSKSLHMCHRAKIAICAVERHRLPQTLQKLVHMGLLTCCSMTTPGIQALNLDTVPSRYMKGRGIKIGRASCRERV